MPVSMFAPSVLWIIFLPLSFMECASSPVVVVLPFVPVTVIVFSLFIFEASRIKFGQIFIASMPGADVPFDFPRNLIAFTAVFASNNDMMYLIFSIIELILSLSYLKSSPYVL